MAELGPDSEKMHAWLGKDIVDAHIDTLLAVGSKAGVTALAAQDSADYDIKVKCFDDAGAVCDNLADFIENNDIVLVKGSRIAALEKTVEKMKELFDTEPPGPSTKTTARSGKAKK
jgi:UDP-N-acetylmuramoyl-tripeptide--D-alanyl-D-alanine ligase